jgi:peptidyl-tRNA hydrolase, PTH1 family
VLHDELDLPFAEVRCKIGGGNAGHNGLKSISQQCGNTYRRIRVGIGHPQDRSLVHGHVLGDFSRIEEETIEALCRKAAELFPLVLIGKEHHFTTELMQSIQI